jgi:hypothetical protein
MAVAIGLVPGKVTNGFDNAKGLKGTLVVDVPVDVVVAVIVGVVLTRGLGGGCCCCCC